MGSSTATDFTIAGQQGAPGTDGGDLVLQAGAHDGGSNHGAVKLAGANGVAVVSVTDDAVQVAQQITVQLSSTDLNNNVAGIDAGAATIQTTGEVQAGSVVATNDIQADTVVAQTSVTVPTLLGTDRDADDGLDILVVDVGDDDAFTMQRPDNSAGAGTDFTIRGQQGDTASNGAGWWTAR